jgi:uncharacterized membrane protein HdeD (DUF308 family)
MLLLIILVVLFIFIGVFEIVQSTRKKSKIPVKVYPVLKVTIGILSILIAVLFVIAIISLNFQTRFPGMLL